MEKAAGHALMAVRPISPEGITLFALDLDHVSPEIGELHTGVGAGPVLLY
jgi:hypothetical protein